MANWKRWGRAAGQLEKQVFEVLLSSLQHGVDTYAVWKAKCLDRDSVVHFQRLSHTSARHTRAREIADSVISEDRGLGWQTSLKKFESVDATSQCGTKPATGFAKESGDLDPAHESRHLPS